MPLVSIIMATYNSSHLLKYSIQSIINSDFEDWELIVIGDCCTDDTEECINRFNDNRITFHNLEVNSGQQAKPNNVGLNMAKGEYIAFLNQDDLYFPSHLTRCLQEISNSNAEMIVTPGIVIDHISNLDGNKPIIKVHIDGAHALEKYSANILSVASTWFLKSSILSTVGPWKMENEVYWSPSQEWLLRAHAKGIKMYFPRRIGVMIIYSGTRKGSYTRKYSLEHEFLFPRLNDKAFLAELMEQSALHSTISLNQLLYYKPSKLFKRLLGYFIDSIAISLGRHPYSFRLFLYGNPKGKKLQKIKNHTGL